MNNQQFNLQLGRELGRGIGYAVDGDEISLFEQWVRNGNVEEVAEEVAATSQRTKTTSKTPRELR